jgi:hypothetical protein
MKKTLCRISGVLALAFLTATPALRAQDALLVNIPFAFTAGKMTLPAGEYRIQKAADTSPALLIQSTDRGASGLVMSMAVDTNRGQNQQSKAVFHKYGERYFLCQVWTAGHSRGRQLPESAKEKEQALAAHNQRPEEITIVARLTTPKP